MERQYIKLTERTILKLRYNQWYLIDVKNQEKERFLVEEDSIDVLYFLFQGKSIQETAYEFGFSYEELYDFLLILNQEELIEFIDKSTDSVKKCYNIKPPLDGLNLLITNTCNLHCIYCYLDSGKAMKDELNGELWIDILQQAQQLGVFHLSVSGGEPLLHEDFYKIAEYIASISTFSANLNTNGTVSIDGYENLLNKAFKSVQVSIDDIITEKHDIFRSNSGCFKESIRTIERLISYGIETNVGFLINSKNLSALDGVVDLCEQIGVKNLNIGFVNPIGRAKKNRFAFPITYQSLKDGNLIERMYQKFCEFAERDTKLKILLPFQPKVTSSIAFKNKHYICGGDNIQFMSIMADGTIMPCDVLPISAFNYGNVKAQSLIDIWMSDKMKAFKLMSFKQFSDCCNCSYFQICEGPCMARASQTKELLQSQDLLRCLITQKIAG